MSSRLIAGGEASACEPMPWSTASSPAPRTQKQSSGGAARQPEIPNASEPRDDLRARIAALEQGIHQARAAGRAEGEAQARMELQPVLQKLAAAIHESAELRGRLRSEAETDLVRLAIAIARRILSREMHTDPDAITGLVKAGLERLRVQEVLRVRLHPEHTARVAEYLGRFGAAQVEVLGDPACERGAVLFETSRGNLDASMETQLREIERGLTDRTRGKMA